MDKKVIILFSLISTLLLACGGCVSSEDYGVLGSDVSGGASASVNGSFISREELENLTVGAYGRTVLEDMILLELVTQYAKGKGVVLSEQMYQQEYEGFLEEIASGKIRSEQEIIFNYMLRKRNISRDIFDLILRKQALLRAVVDREVSVTDDMFDAEFLRQFGQRRIVRIIVVSSMRKMEAVEALLAVGGDFDEIALEHSEDELSLRNQALAGPFTIADDVYAPRLVEEVFALARPGDISRSFILSQGPEQRWYKLKLESVIPAQDTDISQHRSELEKIIIRKEIDKRTTALQEKLRNESRVIIMDNRVKD